MAKVIKDEIVFDRRIEEGIWRTDVYRPVISLEEREKRKAALVKATIDYAKALQRQGIIIGKAID